MTTNITSIYKKGKKDDLDNYRSVSLTSIPEIVMERLVLDTISKQLEEKKAIGRSQHGSTKGSHA